MATHGAHFLSDFALGFGMFVNMSETDLQLLTRYTRQRAEDAFAEVVHRHVDLVHSAALRQVRSPELAEEVTQAVFIELARRADQLPCDTVVGAWLYNQTRRRAIDVVRLEASRRLREQSAQELQAMNATAEDWTDIEPILDDAMDALEQTDRLAVLLRYFQNKPLREVGQIMGVTDDAAQKRVGRAVERLREFFARRGVTLAASGLIVVISTNAAQAAPVGLAITISALAGTTFATTAIATATKAIVMTTLQKTLVTATLLVAVGAGIYEARQAAIARAEVQTLRQQQAPVAEQIPKPISESDDAISKLAVLSAENERSQRETAELLKLRDEVGLLKQRTTELSQQLATSSNAYGLLPGQMPPVRSSSVQENAQAYADLILKAASGSLNLAEEYNLAKAWPYLERKFREPADFALFQTEYLAEMLGIKDENLKWELRRTIENARDTEHKKGLEWTRMSEEEIQRIAPGIDMNKIRSQWNELNERSMTAAAGLLSDAQREILASSFKSLLDFDPRLKSSGENVADDPKYQHLTAQEIRIAFLPDRPGRSFVPARKIDPK